VELFYEISEGSTDNDEAVGVNVYGVWLGVAEAIKKSD